MEIFDNGYLTEQEKNTLDTQDLIYLAVSLYAGKAHSNILPKYVYKYGLNANKDVYRWKLVCADENADMTNSLWSIYTGAQKGHPYPVWKKYYLDAYLNDNGEEVPWTNDCFSVNIPIHVIDSNMNPYEEDALLFSEWVSDDVYLSLLEETAS